MCVSLFFLFRSCRRCTLTCSFRSWAAHRRNPRHHPTTGHPHHLPPMAHCTTILPRVKRRRNVARNSSRATMWIRRIRRVRMHSVRVWVCGVIRTSSACVPFDRVSTYIDIVFFNFIVFYCLSSTLNIILFAAVNAPLTSAASQIATSGSYAQLTGASSSSSSSAFAQPVRPSGRPTAGGGSNPRAAILMAQQQQQQQQQPVRLVPD